MLTLYFGNEVTLICVCTFFDSRPLDPSFPARDLVVMQSQNILKHGSLKCYA